LRDWGEVIGDNLEDEEAPFAGSQATQLKPGAFQPDRVLQLSDTTIIGDGNVIGDASSSYVIKVGSGAMPELPAERFKYLDALQRMHTIIANLAEGLLPEFQEYEQNIRTILEQNTQHLDANRQVEWAMAIKQLNDLVRRAGLNVSLQALTRP